jgi:hypothetical protein
MPNAIINEFACAGHQPGGVVQAAAIHNATKVVEIGGTSVQSAETEPGTNLVRVYAEADCSIKTGADPTASAANGIALAAGTYDYFVITPGHKIAVISRTVS